jgi:predicted transcriptional regulator YdeE
MENISLDQINLIGISLNSKTTNQNGQSGKDCGSLWKKFESEKIAERIPNKVNNDIYAVYHDYEGDHSQPFAFFIGCVVNSTNEVPAGMHQLNISAGQYQKIVAKGKMPDCVMKAWQEIWESGINRAYTADFEIYSEQSQDSENAEVDLFISTK